MILDIFLIIIIIASFIFLLRIFLSKLPFLSKIETSQILKEKQKNLKFKILEKKLFKKINESKLLNTINDFTNKKIETIQNKFLILEAKYLKKHIEFLKKDPLKIDKKVIELVKEGEELLNNNNYQAAEKKFKDVLSLDPRNLIALKNIAEMSLKQKKYTRAKDIFKYILELNKQTIKWWRNFRKEEKIPDELNNEMVSTLISLGIIFQENKKYEQAIKFFKNTFDYIPNNPKVLDFLIENLIILRKKSEAEIYLKQIKEVNPDNQKINDWEEKIKAINFKQKWLPG